MSNIQKDSSGANSEPQTIREVLFNIIKSRSGAVSRQEITSLMTMYWTRSDGTSLTPAFVSDCLGKMCGDEILEQTRAKKRRACPEDTFKTAREEYIPSSRREAVRVIDLEQSLKDKNVPLWKPVLSQKRAVNPVHQEIAERISA